MTQREEHDPRPEQHALGDRGERRQRDPEVEDRVVEREVLARPDRVVAELLRQLGHGAEATRVGRLVGELTAALDAEQHVSGASTSGA